MSALAVVSRLFAPTTEVVKDQDYIQRNANCTIRLYYKNRMVHQQHVYLTISRLDDKLHYGAGQLVRMEGFTGQSVNGASIALIGVPYESDISWGEEYIPPGDTLSLQAHKWNGLLTLTTDKESEYRKSLVPHKSNIST